MTVPLPLWRPVNLVLYFMNTHAHIWGSRSATQYRLKGCFDTAAELGEQMLSLCVKDHS